jgi:hypothetical protein
VSTETAHTTPPTNGHGTPGAAGDGPNFAAGQRLALIAAAAGLGVYAAAGAANYATAGEEAATRQWFLSWTVGYVFWFSLPVGGLALLMIHYLAKTSWGLLLTRSLEAATRTLPLFALLFIPVAIGAFAGEKSPYWWSDPHVQHVNKDAGTEIKKPVPNETYEERRKRQVENFDVLQKKAVEHEQQERQKGTASFLSPTMFVACGVLYFAVWGVMIYLLNKWGQDAQNAAAGDRATVEAALKKCQNLSGPGLILYAMTVTAAASQWVMSLEPSWASTMFPVIFAVNQFLTCFAFCVSLFLLWAGKAPFAGVVRPKFQLDMGSLMLAFTLFWTYTSFSQMMLVWIGNLPEEIPFYLKRSDGGWWYASAGLIAFHFALPFILLLFRDIKLHPKRLRIVALYLLVVCAVDVCWWIEPSAQHEHQFLYLLMDLGATVGIGGVFGFAFVALLKKRPILPTNQVYMLPEGHHDGHH